MSNILISIAGDSGAGKSSLLKFLSNLWDNNVLLVEGDAYHKWERNDTHWNGFTPLNPAANNIDQCYVDLLSLKNNKIISFKEYNHSTGKFDPPKDLMPKNRIIFTGLHALYDQRISFVYTRRVGSATKGGGKKYDFDRFQSLLLSFETADLAKKILSEKNYSENTRPPPTPPPPARPPPACCHRDFFPPKKI